MKLFPIVPAVLGAAASVLGQTIELAAPQNGTVLFFGESFTARVVLPEPHATCTEVGIALAMAHCESDVCPPPSEGLGSVLYTGPWEPTAHSPGGTYQDFTLQVPDSMSPGSAVFTLVHLCLLAPLPVPYLESRNVSVRIGFRM